MCCMFILLETIHAEHYSNIVALNNTATDLTCKTTCNVSLKWERCSWPYKCNKQPPDTLYTNNDFSKLFKSRSVLNQSTDGHCVYRLYNLVISDAGRYICSIQGRADRISTINLIMLGELFYFIFSIKRLKDQFW